MLKKCIQNVFIGVVIAGSVAAVVMAPSKPKQAELIHVERVHVLEPGETILSVAKQYFPEQKEFDNLPQFIFAVRLANGDIGKTFKPCFKAGDRIVIPMAVEK